MNERSFDLYSKEHAASEKFDYFICSLAGALFAYIGQSYVPHILNSWYYFLMPIALLGLSVCFLAGLMMINNAKHITRINKEYIQITEENDHIKKLCMEKDKEGKPIQQFLNPAGQWDSRGFIQLQFKKNQDRIKTRLDEAAGLNTLAGTWANVRNYSLAIGFLLILSSKIMQPYFTDTVKSSIVPTSTPIQFTSTNRTEVKLVPSINAATNTQTVP